MTHLKLLLLLSLLWGTSIHAQSNDERDAIRAAALDYIEGWYSGDADRMERALHPELAKRMVVSDAERGQSFLDQQSAMTLVQNTRAGYGTDIPTARQLKEVTILDVFENAASVKVDASGWIDYLHLARWNGQWKIVNVLWELKPREDTQ